MKTPKPILILAAMLCIPGLAMAGSYTTAEILRVEQPSYFHKFKRGEIRYTKRDIDDARQQAELGDVESQYNLGVMLATNDRTREAAYWFDKAVNRGHPLAEYNLAVLYFNGDGVDKDVKKAAELLRRSAEHNNADAQFLYGRLHYTGQGVERNLAREAEWYRRAAENGHAEAQYNLGVLYYLGQGVEQDNIEAYAWWSTANEHGLDTSDPMEILGREMSDAEIDEALRRTRQLFSGR